MKIKAEREEKRRHSGKDINVTVVERELTKEEQFEARLASLEARVAALENRIGPKPQV